MKFKKPRTLLEVCITQGPFIKTLNGINYCQLSTNQKEIKCPYLKKANHPKLRHCSLGRFMTQN